MPADGVRVPKSWSHGCPSPEDIWLSGHRADGCRRSSGSRIPGGSRRRTMASCFFSQSGRLSEAWDRDKADAEDGPISD